jgi:hypothetical protein
MNYLIRVEDSGRVVEYFTANHHDAVNLRYVLLGIAYQPSQVTVWHGSKKIA